jgi:SAM-dependent methyltransferase
MDQTDRIRQHFDVLADGEWERLDAHPRGRVAFEIHRRFLAKFLRPGNRVLEVGAGPGRFTIAMAQMGATVLVTDISPVQLDLNRQHVADAGCESAVEARYLLDVRDTERFSDQEFDAVIAFGGPLSYVFEDAQIALSGLLRVGKVVLGSVMSTLGAWRFFLAQIVEQTAAIGQEATDLIIETGDLRHQGSEEGHTCQMYRYRELTQLVSDAGGQVLSSSASNWASLGDQVALEAIASNPDGWNRFLEHEVAACREQRIIDGGTHIVFAAKSRADVSGVLPADTARTEH